MSALSALGQAPGASIDVQHYRFAINLNDADNVIKGQAILTVKFLKRADKFTLDLAKQNSEGKGMLVTALKENGKAVVFLQDSDKLIINTKGAPGSVHSYRINYQGTPTDGLIISTNQYKRRTFFGDNWATRARNWLPCVDHPADKASVEFLVTAPAHYKVVANGLKVAEKVLPGNKRFTHWRETAKLPTKVMVIGVADFAVANPGTPGGTPVYTYVFPEDKEVGFKSYAVATKILPWFAGKIGPFPYKKLANVQSKTIFGGMENAGAIFYYEKSVNDKGIEALMAHEIAHQWFGDAISEKTWQHVWLSESFATYMANLYLEGTYGPDSLKSRLEDDRKLIFAFEKQYLAPVVDSAFKGPMINMLNTNAYQKGGWVLHMLRRKIGDKAFWKGVGSYYKLYNGSNANTDDLRAVMEKVSGTNLKPFFYQWLRTSGHPQLKISQVYNDAAKTVAIHVNQLQALPYQFTLELLVDGKLYQMNIKGAETILTVSSASAKPDIKVDPDVNLLASFVQ
ncbi:M1 family metallopeptidase [Mucilaginibacter sp. AK015]|uniref:M1 family metallopeptidase n=1 Tax=Mucilaginibacter sp. AK015 TaxID=2723072 RepID=UPI00160BA8EC|nr:M1 family metallopeptidase [Mucilaginibacter sp. AK015]MBB5397138.1 aminopeptidase N [Mucilaginibacter sp. AK015]